ncbi:MAG: hypothetical protein JWM73_344 [Solirubrobacterales bacterium]|nr:hypothetical protein [Solirubrobacterales bacterium]
MRSSPLASRSVTLHYARGLAGLLALVTGVAMAAAGTSAGVALLIVTVAAWRGCPTCWAIGLMQTRERAAGASGRAARPCPCSSSAGSRPCRAAHGG